MKRSKKSSYISCVLVAASGLILASCESTTTTNTIQDPITINGKQIKSVEAHDSGALGLNSVTITYTDGTSTKEGLFSQPDNASYCTAGKGVCVDKSGNLISMNNGSSNIPMACSSN